MRTLHYWAVVDLQNNFEVDACFTREQALKTIKRYVSVFKGLGIKAKRSFFKIVRVQVRQDRKLTEFF